MRLVGKAILLAVLTSGCVRVERGIGQTISAEGIETLSVRSERGDVFYDGRFQDRFEIYSTSWGRGGGEAAATSREAENDLTTAIYDEVLALDSTTGVNSAGVDHIVDGPSVMNLDIDTRQGQVWVENVDGYHVVTASDIIGDNLSGDADFYADTMNISIDPYDDSVIRLDAFGDVTLYLPAERAYDMTVWGDPAFEMEVTDLGFDDFLLDAGYFSGRRGLATIRVDVTISGGGFYLYELR